MNVEDTARGLGFVMVRTERVTTSGNAYTAVRWNRVNKYLQEFGFSQLVEKDDYIPENIFYRLAIKAKNETAEKFVAWVCDEVLPTLRRTEHVSLPTAEPKSQDKPLADRETPQNANEVTTPVFSVRDIPTKDLMAEVNRRREEVKLVLAEARKEAALLQEPPQNTSVTPIVTDPKPVVKRTGNPFSETSRQSITLKDLLPIVEKHTGQHWTVTSLYNFCLLNHVAWAKMPPIGPHKRRKRETYRVRQDSVLHLLR